MAAIIQDLLAPFSTSDVGALQTVVVQACDTLRGINASIEEDKSIPRSFKAETGTDVLVRFTDFYILIFCLCVSIIALKTFSVTHNITYHIHPTPVMLPS